MKVLAQCGGQEKHCLEALLKTPLEHVPLTLHLVHLDVMKFTPETIYNRML